MASFWEAGLFSGGKVSFTFAEFSGGTVGFSGEFSAGEVSFNGAKFSAGEVSFGIARFSGGKVSFDGAGFSGGNVDFGHAGFSGGEVSFDGAGFSGGEVDFGGAGFSGGRVSFYAAGFSAGEVDFGGAIFRGGEVDFRNPHKWSRAPIFDWAGTGPPPAGSCFLMAQLAGHGMSRAAQLPRILFTSPPEGVLLPDSADVTPRHEPGSTAAGDGKFAEILWEAHCPCGSGRKFKLCHGDPGMSTDA